MKKKILMIASSVIITLSALALTNVSYSTPPDPCPYLYGCNIGGTIVCCQTWDGITYMTLPKE